MLNHSQPVSRQQQHVIDAFRTFAAKGSSSMPGSRRTADRAWRTLAPLLGGPLRGRVTTARGAALRVDGDGGAMFDAVMLDVAAALGVEVP